MSAEEQAYNAAIATLRKAIIEACQAAHEAGVSREVIQEEGGEAVDEGVDICLQEDEQRDR